MTDSQDVTVPTAKRPSPGKLGLWFARAPKYLYHAGLGRLMTRRFVLVEHTGRKTGIARETVLEVIRRNQTSLDVAAAHGPTSDWYRNLRATPEVRISTGKLRSVPALAETLDADVARTVFEVYSREHPRAAKFLSKAVGLPMGDAEAMASTVQLVRLSLTGRQATI